MKAKFFFLGLCALALAACSLDEVSQVNDTNAVKFKATTSTRATATTTNNLTEFSVWAWNTNEYGVSNEFMDDVIATKNGSVFTTSPLYFWPTGTVDFYALSPTATLTGVETDADGNQVESAYLGGELSDEGDDEGNGWTYTGNVAKAQIYEDNITLDVVVPGKASDQIDLCYAITKGQSSGSVSMNFRHALSQVVFKAKSVNEAFTVDVAGVSVCSVYKEGTYTLPQGEKASTTADITESDENSHGTWSTETHKARFEAGVTSQTLPTDGTTVDLTAEGGALMLLPQQVEKWDVYIDTHDEGLGSYIRILCHVEENGSQLWPNSTEENYEPATGEDSPVKVVDEKEYAEIAVPVDVDWEEGCRYTYTIVFGEGLGYYPPDDPNYELDGTPILVPITFTVTVDEFQDAVAAEEGQYDVSTNTDVIVTTAADLVAAFNRGLSPIEIAANITLDGCVVLSEGTIDVTIDEGCTLTIENSHESSGSSWAAFYVTGGTLNLYGDGDIVYVDDNSTGDSFYAVWVGGTDAVANIYGCTIQGYPDCVYAQTGYAYIYGGTFYGTGTYNGRYWLLNCLNANYNNGTANIYVYGGTYKSFDPSNPQTDDTISYVVDGYGVVTSTDDDGNTWYTVVPVVTPTSLAELLTAVEEGAPIITITESMELTDTFLEFTEDCVLTLADGVVLTPQDVTSVDDNANIGETGTATSAIHISGGTLTVNAGEGAGIITNGSSSLDTSCFWLDGGNLIINGGTYYGGTWNDPTGQSQSGSSATVYVEYGFAYIYGGTFSSGWSGSMKQTSILNCWDTARKSNEAWIYVYGGEYRNFDPANNNAEGTGTNFVVDGYKSVQSDTADTDGLYWYTVVEE